MRRLATSLPILLVLACSKPADQAEGAAAKADAGAEPEPPTATPVEPVTKPEPEIVREDLVAGDLPTPPTLDTLALAPARSGEFPFPEGSDELAPRAAVELRDGLLIVGQAYLDRRPGSPPKTWRWIGAVPGAGAASSTMHEPGAIRAAASDGEGGALLTGTRGVGFDVRGWFGRVDGAGSIGLQVELDSPNSTELFDVLPGAADGELALVAGYVDAQGWVVSLDASGAQRWQKFIGSYGYTQIREFARLDDQLLAIGTRSQKFGESWWARIPADGGADPSPADVTQDKLEIEGADEHQMLRALVELGDGSFIALGTAKKNYLQDHDQVVAVGFDRAGAPTWSRVVTQLRATEVFGGVAHADGARFVVGVPAGEGVEALGLLDVSATSATARQLDDSAGWQSAGFVEGRAGAAVLSWAPIATGVAWRELPVADGS
jgi:hypothetical protein